MPFPLNAPKEQANEAEDRGTAAWFGSIVHGRMGTDSTTQRRQRRNRSGCHVPRAHEP